ncbi:MAG: hypothetical protein ABIC40_04950 [bacterium]
MSRENRLKIIWREFLARYSFPHQVGQLDYVQLLPIGTVHRLNPELPVFLKSAPCHLEMVSHVLDHARIEPPVRGLPVASPIMRMVETQFRVFPRVTKSLGELSRANLVDLAFKMRAQISEPVKLKYGSIARTLNTLKLRLKPWKMELGCGHGVKIDRFELGESTPINSGLAEICSYPIMKKAIPWGNLDRETILACWELLRGQAYEELGYDPGRDLEMSGIFLDVNLKGVRRTVFDPVRRELKLFPALPILPGKKRQMNPLASYVIIGGTVKGTDRILTITLDPDSYGWQKARKGIRSEIRR